MEKLGKYFTVQEFEHSDTAIWYGWNNRMNKQERHNAQVLVEKVLDPLREYLGRPLTLSSGFRGEVLNTRIGGSKTSQHRFGQAADCNAGAKGFRFIKENLPFDQLIWEFGNDKEPQWVHVSYRDDGPLRKEVLRARKVNGKTVYERLM